MAKPPKKKFKPKPVQETKKEASPKQENYLLKNYPYIITGVFFLLSYIGIMNHEPWRDEYQAWLVARDAHSFPELLQNLKYEGNPVFWHFFLWIFTTFTHNPFIMQVFHILLSTAFIFLLNRHAPFAIYNKVLFTFGYYSFYEFNLISRSYGLGFLLVVIFLVLYKERRKYYLLISILLFFLANTHVYGLLLSVFFSGIMLLDYRSKTRSGEFGKIPFVQLALCVLIIGAGWVTSALQIYPEKDSSFPVTYPNGFEWIRMKFSIWRIVTSYTAFPRFSDPHFWNTSFFESIQDLPNGTHLPDVEKMYTIVPLIIFLVFCAYFLRKPLVLLLYGLGTLVLVYFFYYSLLVFTRYTSHLTVLLITSMWMAGYYPEEVWYESNLLMKASAAGKVIGKYLFTLLLAIGFFGGILAYSKDMKYEFSASGEMTDFLKKNNLEKLPILGVTDFVVSPAAAVFDRKIFYPQRKCEGSFVIWDKKRNDSIRYPEIIAQMQDMDKKGTKRMLLITDNQPNFVDPVTHENKPLEEGMITNELYLKLLKRVDPGIVADEKYFIYLVEDRPMQPQNK